VSSVQLQSLENFSQHAAKSILNSPLRTIRAVWATGDRIGTLRVAARDDVVPCRKRDAILVFDLDQNFNEMLDHCAN